ncbi:alpha/beta family hydrolase [Sphingobium sp. WCS2017Hpa-17]|uniref:alpha/beta hydrolase family protein n=1 Tax=Sphingobium sp. WCS2017Hpa-17 TaxID=3073638 RepID=UPI002889BD6C|nr:alpha/beta family hydrolase [Sphingobium sp. WCS2017Hpa-17]
MDMEHHRIAVGEDGVSAIFIRPVGATALFLFAHGAGAGMTHPTITANALGLAARGIATLRYQFLYMEKGSKRPDQPVLAHKVVRAAAAHAAALAPDLPLFAGGRSFGGRMTSQAQADTPLPGVRGLAFLGFPLHPAGKPGVDRAAHLQQIRVPMLFLSGTRDALADIELLRTTAATLGRRATLHLVDQADHSFKVAKKSGRTPTDVETELLDRAANWMQRAVAPIS